MMFLSKKCKKSIGTNVIKDVRVPFLGSKENSSMLQHCKTPEIQKHVNIENDSHNNRILMLMVLSNLTCQFSKKSEKMAYNFNEYVDMLLCLGASNDNASEAAREYARLYPQRRHPDAKVIRRLMQRLRENGQIMPLYVNRGRPREVRTPALEKAILEAIENAPGRSTSFM
jgi:hypothetical protein